MATQTTFRPASDKQIAFLRKLAAEKQAPPGGFAWGDDFDRYLRAMENDGYPLSSPKASKLIDWLMSLPRKRVDSGKTVAEANGQAIKPGVYRGRDSQDSTLYKVYKARGGDHMLCARIVVHSATDVEFIYAGGARRFVDGASRLTLDEAKAFGHEFGICICCGKLLTVPESVAAGIGPVCAGKYDR